MKKSILLALLILATGCKLMKKEEDRHYTYTPIVSVMLSEGIVHGNEVSFVIPELKRYSLNSVELSDFSMNSAAVPPASYAVTGDILTIKKPLAILPTAQSVVVAFHEVTL